MTLTETCKSAGCHASFYTYRHSATTDAHTLLYTDIHSENTNAPACYTPRYIVTFGGWELYLVQRCVPEVCINALILLRASRQVRCKAHRGLVRQNPVPDEPAGASVDVVFLYDDSPSTQRLKPSVNRQPERKNALYPEQDRHPALHLAYLKALPYNKGSVHSKCKE